VHAAFGGYVTYIAASPVLAFVAEEA